MPPRNKKRETAVSFEEYYGEYFIIKKKEKKVNKQPCDNEYCIIFVHNIKIIQRNSI